MAKTVGKCRTLALMHILGKKWSVPILEIFFSAKHSETRFNAIRSRTGITPKNLSEILDDLREADIIERVGKQEYEGYALTRKGVALQGFVNSAKQLGVHLYGIDPECTMRRCNECDIFRGRS